MAIVVDNSVVVGWLLPTQATAYTRRILERVRRERPIVPSLWVPEIANALLTALRRGMLRRAEVFGLLRQIEKFSIEVDYSPLALRSVVELGERHRLTAYDATYLELAVRRGLPLATRDTRLARAARAAGVPIA